MRCSSRRTVTGLMLAGVLVISACSGGGGNVGEPVGEGLLIRITADGFSGSLWETPGLTPSGCASGIPLNGRITFTFNGPVDAASVPPPGPARSPIRISLPGGVAPTVGSFSVADEPSLPVGNRRRLVFTPIAPASLSDPNSGGYISTVTHEIEVEGAASSGPLLTIGGRPLAAGAFTCFDPCLVPPGTPSTPCLSDLVPGNPFITETWPPMGADAPAPLDPGALTAGSALNPVATTDNTVTLRISEPLLPKNIDLSTIRLVNASSGAQVPGQVIFHQAGSALAGADTSRIDYVATAMLLPGVVYQLEIDALVRDLGNNPLLQIPGDPAARLRFATTAVPFCPQPPLVETFDDDTHLASQTHPAPLAWGGGLLQATFPLEIVGDGSFGPMNFGPGNHILDAGLPPSPGFAEGVWDTTSVSVAAGAAVRVVGNRPVHVRSLGSVTISGTLNLRAGTTVSAPLGSPDQAPRAGQFDNGLYIGGPVVYGGVGGPGAGRGGNASQGGTQRTERGEPGFGPTIDGQPNPGTLSPETCGGGQGGHSGLFPALPPASLPGEVGGLGGAGGSSWSSGEVGQPEDVLMDCLPITTAPHPLAQPTGATSSFFAPVSAVSAGSGGGGGGDRIQDLGTVWLDDQGGGGGAGGGGLRISSAGDITISVGGLISTRASSGGRGSLFAGAGGGGSGGMIWLQSFDQILIDPQATLSVAGGSATQPCTRHQSGKGGDGLFQFEDVDGSVNVNFIGSADAGGMNVFPLRFPFSTTVESHVISTFLDTGYGDPDYSGATLATDPGVSLGNVPGASVQILYEGAHESLTSPGTPDLATLSPPVSGAGIDQLDGYRFIRFQVVVSYAAPPTSTSSDILPSIQEISIDYASPAACP